MLRSLLRSPGPAAATMFTIALGVGALTAALGLADAALWRHPPFPDAGRLVLLANTRQSASEPLRPERWSYPRIQRLRQDLRSLPHVANFTTMTAALTGTELTESVTGEVVSPEYFGVLGVVPQLGRVFAAAEDATPGGHPVVVLSHDLWQRRFGGPAEIVGRQVELNGQRLTVIGVMPAGFNGLSDQARFWVPTTMAPLLNYEAYLTTTQNFIGVAGRLPAGVSLADLRAELAVLGPALARAEPSDDDDGRSTVGATAVFLTDSRVTRELRRSVYLLLGAVLTLHLLASANTVSLLLGQALASRREAAVRSALGAERGTLFRSYLLRSAATVAGGALLGLPLAWAATWIHVPLRAWGARNAFGGVGDFADPAFGFRTLIAWLVVTGMTVAIVAPGPALASVRGDLALALRGGARGGTDSGLSLRRPSARAAVVALEAALAVMLLALGGLMIESFARMRGTPLGVDAERVLTFELRPPGAEPPSAQAVAFIDRVAGAVSGLPAVEAVSVDGGAPLAGSASTTLRIVGRPDPDDEGPVVFRHYVGPDHFRVLGIPLLRGRPFLDTDRAGSPPVALVSASAATRHWPGEDPIGRRIWFGGSAFTSPDSSAEIVGIVGDVEYRPLDGARNPASVYTPYRQFTYGWRTWFVRTAGDPLEVVPSVRAAIHSVEPDAAVTSIRPLEDLIDSSWSRNRFDAWFFGGFGVVALLIAASGIYAVVSYAVRQRDREVAIRLAVGAAPAAVFRMVVRDGMAFPIIGLALGGAATLLATGFLRGAVYGVSPGDPRVLGTAMVVLATVAALACAVPARRAMRVNPQDALRTD